MNAEQNFKLLQEIDANRQMLLLAYRDNPQLLFNAEPRIRQWMQPWLIADAVGGATESLEKTLRVEEPNA